LSCNIKTAMRDLLMPPNWATPTAARKIRFLTAFELVFVGASAGLGLFYYHLGALPLAYASFLFALLGIGVLVILRRSESVSFVGNGAVFVLWAFLFAIRYQTGATSGEGLALLNWIWNGVVILLAVYVSGYRGGAVWACLVFVETGVGVYLYQKGHAFPNLIPVDVLHTYSLGSYLTGLLVLMLLAFLFEKERQEALERERQKARTIRDSAEYFEGVLRRSPVPTFVIDRKHRVVEWNRACEVLTGVSREDVLGKRVWDGFALDEGGSLADQVIDDPRSILERFKERILSSSESGSFALESYLPKVKGGMQTILNASLIKDLDGRTLAAIQTVQDPRACGSEAGLMSARIGGCPEWTPFPMFEINASGRISSWSKACEDLLGYAPAEAMALNPLSLVAEADCGALKEAVVEAIKQNRPREMECRCLRKDGSVIEAVVGLRPIPSEANSTGGCVVGIADVTRLNHRIRAVEREATDARERLRRLSQEHDLLKGNVASLVRQKKT
jgi:PAS domain S-box-containing protein